MANAVDICRADEITKEQMKTLTEQVSDIGAVHKKQNHKFSNHQQEQKTISRNLSSQRNNTVQQKQTNQCLKCGRRHQPKQCPAYGTECRKCKKKNHWARQCRSKKFIKEIHEKTTEDGSYVIEAISNHNSMTAGDKEATVIIQVEDCNVKMKIDTGAEVDVMPLRVFKQLNNRCKEQLRLNPTNMKLLGYGGSEIMVLGKCNTKCKAKDKEIVTDFYVVETDSRTVLGFQSCKALNLIKVMCSVEEELDKSKDRITDDALNFTVKKIEKMSGESLKNEVLQMYPNVFTGLGNLTPAYKMQIQSEVMPVVYAPRKIPATIREKLKDELVRMEKDGVIAKVDIPTEWVHSLVIVEKPNGTLRICLDPHDLNKAIKREHFQLPSWEEISGRIADAKFFTKIDANHGYWQIPLHKESSMLTTFNTPIGR